MSYAQHDEVQHGDIILNDIILNSWVQATIKKTVSENMLY